ncbi:MAG: hypothetical protein JWO81_1808 [Alphaproteobacteria bacterium]|nr:hypothetical protein [Alphaproteobacteria bacterium]
MAASRMIALAATALLCGCGGGGDEDNLDASNQSVSAEGKAQEGKISFKAPGVDITFSVPKELTVEAKARRDSKVLYPGAILAGMAVAAGEKGGQGGDTDTEVRFKTADPPEKVAAWYHDPARAEGFRLKSERRQGSSFVFTGIQRRDKDPFKASFGPGAGGGTEGRLRTHDSD